MARKMSLNQLFDQLIGGQQSGTSEQASNQQTGQQGISDILNKMPGGAMGGLAAGGLLGVLVGNKKARKTAGKLAGGAMAVGGTALLGAFAYKAYRNWQLGKAPSATPAAISHGENEEIAKFDASTNNAGDGKPLQLTLVKAMIAAANADGHIDRDEQRSIFDAVNRMDMDAEDKALVFDTLQNPPDIRQIAALSKGLEQASEIYLVSRLAIDPDHPSEKAYLDDLAMYLSLPDDLREHLESQVSVNA
jgi:uncharacterized membrane protein YebE (DUF533 family)